MNNPIDPAIVEKAAKAMADDWNPERDPILTAMFCDYAQTALEAVAADLRAEGAERALREAADEIEGLYFGGGSVGSANSWGAKQAAKRLRNRADQIAGADQ